MSLSGHDWFLGFFLAPSHFYQLSRSLVVNLNFIDRLDSNLLVVANHETTISEGNRANLMNRLGAARSK